MTKFERAESGDVLLLKGSTYNAIVDAVENYLQDRGLAGASFGHRFRSNSSTASVRNQTGAILKHGSVVEINSPAFTPSQPGFRSTEIYNAVSPTAVGMLYGIMLDPLPVDSVGLCAIAGLAKVQVNVTSTLHKYAKVTAADTAKLVSSYTEDEFKIVWTENGGGGGTGIQWAVVQFHGKPQTMSYVGKPAADIDDTDSGTVNLWDKGSQVPGESVTAFIDWMSGLEGVSEGQEVEVTYYRNEDRWRITGAACEA